MAERIDLNTREVLDHIKLGTDPEVEIILFSRSDSPPGFKHGWILRNITTKAQLKRELNDTHFYAKKRMREIWFHEGKPVYDMYGNPVYEKGRQKRVRLTTKADEALKKGLSLESKMKEEAEALPLTTVAVHAARNAGRPRAVLGYIDKGLYADVLTAFDEPRTVGEATNVLFRRGIRPRDSRGRFKTKAAVERDIYYFNLLETKYVHKVNKKRSITPAGKSILGTLRGE